MTKPTLIAGLLAIGLSAGLLIGGGVDANQRPLIRFPSMEAFSPALPGTAPTDVPSFGGWMPEGPSPARP